MDGWTAAFKGDEAKLQKWLTANPGKVDALSTDRKVTMLYTAARDGHFGCVKLLTHTFSADVNQKNGNDDKSTPLHGACFGGHAAVVEHLLECGASTSTKNAHGETPKENAEEPVKGVTKATKTKILALLQKKPAAVNKRDERKSQKKAATQDDVNNDENSRYYNPVARQRAFAADVARDAYGNVQGAQGDLGNDGAFDGWRLLIYTENSTYLPAVPGAQAKKAIAKKGWDTHTVYTPESCISELESGTYDLFMLCSSSKPVNAHTGQELAKAVQKFHNQGHGCFICADNAPYLVEANYVLPMIFNGMKLEGNTPGGKNLTPGDPDSKGQFDSTTHLITAGLDASIFEGVTICYPTEKNFDRSKWDVFGTSTDGHPVLLATNDDYSGVSEDKPGRMVIDCGWTKFYDGPTYFEGTAGTERYLTNTLTWLANTERFQESVAPHLKGGTTKAGAAGKNKQPVAAKKAQPKKTAKSIKRNREDESDDE